MLHAARQLPAWLIFDVGPLFGRTVIRMLETLRVRNSACASNRLRERFRLAHRKSPSRSQLIGIGGFPGCGTAAGDRRAEPSSQVRLVVVGSSLKFFVQVRTKASRCEEVLVIRGARFAGMSPYGVVEACFPRQIGPAQQGARANAGICHAACYRRTLEMKLQNLNRSAARGAPAPGVAHL